MPRHWDLGQLEHHWGGQEGRKELLDTNLMVSAHRKWLCSACCEGSSWWKGSHKETDAGSMKQVFVPGAGWLGGVKQKVMGTGKLPAWKSPSGLLPVNCAEVSHENLSPWAREPGCHDSSWRDAQNGSK